MKPTRRGIAVVAVVCIAFLQGWLYGQRSLDYVAVPGLVALSVGAVSLWHVASPTVERSTVSPGFPGETRRETVTVEGGSVATIVDSLPEGIGGEEIDRTVSLPFQFERELSFRDRGRYPLGSVTVRQRDPLGLFATTETFDSPTAVTVYPEIHDLDRSRVFGSLLEETGNTGGQSFDRLRKYRDGDSLRRIHWRSTAKHDELLVVDSDPVHRTEPIHVTVEGPAAMIDDLATAAGSLVFLFLDSGYDVSLTLPDERIATDRGRRHRENVLGALATTGGVEWERTAGAATFDTAARVAADISIVGENGTVTVRSDGEAIPFERLRSSPDPAASATTSSRRRGV